MRISYRAQTVKQKLRFPLITCLAYCIENELHKVIDYLREQVWVFVEQQENQGNRELIDERLKALKSQKQDVERRVEEPKRPKPAIINQLALQCKQVTNLLVVIWRSVVQSLVF